MRPVREDFRISGEKVYLRPITIEDTDMVVSWRNQPGVVKNFIYRKPLSREEHMDWLENKVFKGLVHQFIICRNEDGQPLGMVYLQNFGECHRKCEWGLLLDDNQAHGKGIGTQTGELILNYAFKELGIHKVFSRVLAYNKPCRRMCGKLGCVQEAYLKDELFLDGKFEDLILFGSINPNEYNPKDDNPND